MTKIFVSNILYQATEAEIRTLFEPYGTVRNVSIVTEYQSGRSRGFAFLDMPNEAQAHDAIATLNGSRVGGRRLRVEESHPKLPGTVRGEVKRRVG